MRFGNLRAVLSITAILVIFSTGSAFASGSWYWYNVVVPKFGGTTTTNFQFKVANDKGSVQSNSIGSDYVLEVRHRRFQSTPVSNWHDIDDGTWIAYNLNLNGGAAIDDEVQLQLGTKWNTPVNVQAAGHWSPDQP